MNEARDMRGRVMHGEGRQGTSNYRTVRKEKRLEQQMERSREDRGVNSSPNARNKQRDVKTRGQDVE